MSYLVNMVASGWCRCAVFRWQQTYVKELWSAEIGAGLCLLAGRCRPKLRATERVSLLSLCSDRGGVWLWRPEGHLQS